MDSRAKAGGILTLFGIVGVILIIIAFMCIERVPQGTVGVVYSPKGVKEETLSPGWHVVAPMNKVNEYPDNSLVFQVGGNGLPIIIADKKVDCISRYVRFESEESFIGILYRFLEQYAQNVEIIENDGVERDIFVWH